MNRVAFNIIQKGTSPKAKSLEKLCDPNPFSPGFVSENFPVYPITIGLYLDNPPFNKISICFEDNFAPSKGTLYGSEDGLTFKKFHELTDFTTRDQYITIFKQKFFFCYIRLILEQPPPLKSNICKQIKIKGLQFTMVKYFATRYVCSLSSRLAYHPILFKLLEMLEYKALLLKQNKKKLYEKYQARLSELERMIGDKKVDKVYPQQSWIDKWNQQILYIEHQPIYTEGNYQYPDPVKIKRDIFRLQKELRESEVNNFGQIKQHVHNYFLKYHNLTVKDGYLRYLSSNLQEDHYSALVNFWNDVKELSDIDMETEEGIVMYFNYYLEFIESPLKTSALKTLILFDKNNKNSTSATLNPVYERVLFNIFKFLHQTQDEELRTLSLRYCFMLYDKVDNRNFLQQLLDSYNSYTLQQQIQKLQILQKITFRRVIIYQRTQIVNFLTDILLTNKLNLTEKNRAYNVAAYLASKYGKTTIMKDFQKLNSMILMTMEKNIDSKLGKMENQGNHTEFNQDGLNCEYCGVHNKNFKDQNLYDLHLAKECRFITTCDYCNQNVEIPELNKHHVEQCTQKHNYKHCDNCFEVIRVKQEEKHDEKCSKKLETRCPLCHDKVDNKLKLKEHILIEGCPNNPR